MQNDFIDGALETKEAVAIVPGVKEKIGNFDGVVFLPETPTRLIILTPRKERNFLYRTVSVILKMADQKRIRCTQKNRTH